MTASNVNPAPGPGWYPDPMVPGAQRYWDGQSWTPRTYQPTYQETTIVQGPNHVLHALLSLLTFWFFGGWLWIWLFIALNNKKRVRTIR